MSRYCLHVLLFAVLASVEPGRIPKVYNALITSNQNLEPSKAFPVYQPFIHDPFSFPYQPVFYSSEYPNAAPNPAFQPPNNPPVAPPAAAPIPEGNPEPKTSSGTPEQPPQLPKTNQNPQLAPPAPPRTESPIALNEYGLPPQLMPLGKIDPAYQGFNQITHVNHPLLPTYTFPSFRFYDPYEPFSGSPYLNLPPVYRFPSHLAQTVQAPEESKSAALAEEPSLDKSSSTPPPEPSNLSVLNYSPKDTSIPDVPPPPLPSGGMETEKSE